MRNKLLNAVLIVFMVSQIIGFKTIMVDHQGWFEEKTTHRVQYITVFGIPTIKIEL